MYQCSEVIAWSANIVIPQAWHVPEGMAIQFLERPREIRHRMSLDHIKGECKAWDKWYKSSLNQFEGK